MAPCISRNGQKKTFTSERSAQVKQIEIVRKQRSNTSRRLKEW